MMQNNNNLLLICVTILPLITPLIVCIGNQSYEPATSVIFFESPDLMPGLPQWSETKPLRIEHSFHPYQPARNNHHYHHPHPQQHQQPQQQHQKHRPHIPVSFYQKILKSTKPIIKSSVRPIYLPKGGGNRFNDGDNRLRVIKLIKLIPVKGGLSTPSPPRPSQPMINRNNFSYQRRKPPQSSSSSSPATLDIAPLIDRFKLVSLAPLRDRAVTLPPQPPIDEIKRLLLSSQTIYRGNQRLLRLSNRPIPIRVVARALADATQADVLAESAQNPSPLDVGLINLINNGKRDKGGDQENFGDQEEEEEEEEEDPEANQNLAIESNESKRRNRKLRPLLLRRPKIHFGASNRYHSLMLNDRKADFVKPKSDGNFIDIVEDNGNGDDEEEEEEEEERQTIPSVGQFSPNFARFPTNLQRFRGASLGMLGYPPPG